MVVALLWGKLSFSRVWECGRLIWYEGKNHDSPNSGYPEAAAAVLLGVRFGGTSTYQWVLQANPIINSEGRESAPTDLAQLRSLVQHASLLALLLGVGLSLGVNFIF